MTTMKDQKYCKEVKGDNSFYFRLGSVEEGFGAKHQITTLDNPKVQAESQPKKGNWCKGHKKVQLDEFRR